MSSPIATDRRVSPREAALRFLAERIDYERTQSMPNAEAAFKLDRMRELLRRLGDPQRDMPIVHIAGTKGKGSVAAMTAAVLAAAGYRTGLFTSPHLDRVEERVMIDGQPCSAEELADLVDLVRPEVETLDREAAQQHPPEHGPTYFEIVTAAALCHFRRRGVGAAVLEVGLGGRLDSTNVCTPCISIITSISFDHVAQLGDTLAAIAGEKAGIIKPGVPVVSGVVDDEPRDVVRQIARQNGCRLVELGVDFDFTYHPPQHLERSPAPAHFDFRHLSPRNALPHLAPGDKFPHLAPGEYTGGPSPCNNIPLALFGQHQASNAALVLAAVAELCRGGWTIPDAAVRRGLAEVSWPARVEVVSRRPTVVLDAAHNAASIKALVNVLDESFCARRRLLIFATTQDKDLRGMLEQLLGRFDEVIFTRYLNNPRGVPPEELQALAEGLRTSHPERSEGSVANPGEILRFAQDDKRNNGSGTRIAANSAEAWNIVHRLASPDDLICITGSFFLAAEMRRQLAARPLGNGS